jgi:hypothetical protein
MNTTNAALTSTPGSAPVRYFFAFWILHSLEHCKSFKGLPVDVPTSLVGAPDFQNCFATARFDPSNP